MKLVAEIDVEGFQPAPWSVPEICVTRSGHRFTKRRGRSNLADGKPNLKDWQAMVSDAAREAMGDRPPVRGEVKIEFRFRIRGDEGKNPGSPCFVPLKFNKKSLEWTKANFKGSTLPDLTNLEKGTEDALQGIVFLDDFQAVEKTSRRDWGHHGGCTIRVWALAEETHEEATNGLDSDCIEPGDAGRVRTEGAHGKRLRRDDAEPRRSRAKRRPAHH